MQARDRKGGKRKYRICKYEFAVPEYVSVENIRIPVNANCGDYSELSLTVK